MNAEPLKEDGQMSDGWIEHDGGPIPVAGSVYVKTRCGFWSTLGWPAEWLCWSHKDSPYDIVAYKSADT